ncbi:MAG: hypothetical protein OEM67_09690 [Thermoleophilia bacterium]|nr:hypothetical protein [Thermoleophilia bacterium]MDH3724811.1 hypothetical protein [Thermoleophilia bacterium]
MSDDTPDLETVKTRQQAALSAGDYSAMATQVPLPSEMLCEHLDLHAGKRVLDVACGSGNTSPPPHAGTATWLVSTTYRRCSTVPESGRPPSE